MKRPKITWTEATPEQRASREKGRKTRSRNEGLRDAKLFVQGGGEVAGCPRFAKNMEGMQEFLSLHYTTRVEGWARLCTSRVGSYEEMKARCDGWEFLMDRLIESLPSVGWVYLPDADEVVPVER